MLISKFSTQKMIDAGKHKILVVASLLVLLVTMGNYYVMATGFAVTATAYLIGGIIYAIYVDRYYAGLAGQRQ